MSSGLCYEHIMMIVKDDHKWCLHYEFGIARVINYAPRVTFEIAVSLTDESRGASYECNMFIIQATEASYIIHKYECYE